MLMVLGLCMVEDPPMRKHTASETLIWDCRAVAFSTVAPKSSSIIGTWFSFGFNLYYLLSLGVYGTTH